MAMDGHSLKKTQFLPETNSFQQKHMFVITNPVEGIVRPGVLKSLGSFNNDLDGSDAF